MERKEYEKIKVQIQLRVCNVFLIWTKKYPYAFLHPETGKDICKLVLKFLDEVVSNDHLALAKQIRKHICHLVMY